MNEPSPLTDMIGRLFTRLFGLIEKWWLVVGLLFLAFIVIHFNLFELGPECYSSQGAVRISRSCDIFDELGYSLLTGFTVLVGGGVVLFSTFFVVLFLAYQFDQHFEKVRGQALRDSELWRRGFWLARAREGAIALVSACVAFFVFNIAFAMPNRQSFLLFFLVIFVGLPTAALALGLFWQFLMSLLAGVVYWKLRGRSLSHR